MSSQHNRCQDYMFEVTSFSSLPVNCNFYGYHVIAIYFSSQKQALIINMTFYLAYPENFPNKVYSILNIAINQKLNLCLGICAREK